jgi:hypothetical protein
METSLSTAAPVTTTAGAVQRPDTRPGPVSQDELREYNRLRCQRDQLTSELIKRRARLIDRLTDGLPVEAGPYATRLRRCVERALWSKKFEEALGAAERDAQLDEQRGRFTPAPGSTSR